jgi:hypothetical protein
MRIRPRRFLAAALAVLALTSLARAAERVQVERLRLGLDEAIDRFKVGTWVPVRVQLKAGSERFTGMLEVVAPDDDSTPTSFQRPVNLAPGELQWFTAYTRPGHMGADIDVNIYDDQGRRQAGARSTALLSVDILTPDQTLLATLGHPQGVEAIATLPGFGPGNNARGAGSSVIVTRVAVPDGLPGRWYGFDGIDVVIIDTNSQPVVDALDAGRAEALKSWVRNGGHVVISVGANWQRVRDSALAEMLPARPSGRTQVDDLGALEAYTGSAKPITKGVQPVTVTRLEGLERRGGHALDSTATPLLVRGPYGFGRVTLIGLDVDQNPFAKWDDRALFWAKVLDLHRQGLDANSVHTAPTARGSAVIYQSNVNDLSTLIHSSLEQFPGVRLVPFGWVAFFIFLYILLIGPGDYFFLKKVVKRMELTWVTFPLIVVTVSALAYVAAYAIKGTELRVNQVDVLDVDQISGLMRGNSWLTIFSPQNRDYDVAIVPRPLDAAGVPQAAAVAGSERLISYFGVPETVFGGMNSGGNRFGLAGAGYAYEPVERAESIKGVRIPIWSTKSFHARWVAPVNALAIEADLETTGADQLAGTVTNKLNHPLQDARLVFGKRVYNLGLLAPGASVRVELKNDEILTGYLRRLATAFPTAPWNIPRANVARADVARVAMFRAAAGEALSGETAAILPANPLRYLDLSGQLELERPMLFATIDTPAAAIELGSAPSTPKLEQTTVIRVILPLGQPTSEAADAPREKQGQ